MKKILMKKIFFFKTVKICIEFGSSGWGVAREPKDPAGYAPVKRIRVKFHLNFKDINMRVAEYPNTKFIYKLMHLRNLHSRSKCIHIKFVANLP